MASTLLQNAPAGLQIASRRSGFIMETNQVPLQKWLASQQQQQQQQQQHNTSRTVRRQPPQTLSPLKAIPYTTAEWKKLLAEVKRDYTNKRYRPCSSRCVEVLKSVKGGESVQPAYLIYLHFYAASSLEMQVRNLHAASPCRLALLEAAREHYNLASQMTQEADKQIATLSCRPHSPSSSLHSPVDSCLSHSTSSTRMSSPTPSDDSATGQTAKPKKKVAFLDEPEYEPVRPDSPTLGFEDPGSGRNSPDQDIPVDPVPPSVQSMPDTLPLSPSPSLNGDDGFEDQHMDDHNTEVDESANFVERYSTVLGNIQKQIISHLVSIDRDITAALTPRAALSTNEEIRALDLRTRIERLRANGWQRKRFDGKRYEEFREQVMTDMLS